jgi:hypothetical protein
MQIYLFQNGQQEGPFGLPRIVARLVSGDLDSATPAWREGLDNWYPLYHDIWKEAGINAPPPQTQPAPVEEVAPASEPEPEPEPEAEPELVQEAVQPEQPTDPDSPPGESEEAGEAEAPPEEPSPEPEPEPPGEAFANYKEADFKPPTYDQMATEMTELRAKREKFPELIGKQAFESGLRDEEIEEAWAKVEGVKSQGKESALPAAFAGLGRAVMAAGITDPALDEVREEEQEISDRMLNLQMQLRRMGGGDRVKQPSSWPKWIFILVFALFAVGIIVLVTYQFLGREEQIKLLNWFYNTFGFYSDL